MIRGVFGIDPRARRARKRRRNLKRKGENRQKVRTNGPLNGDGAVDSSIEAAEWVPDNLATVGMLESRHDDREPPEPKEDGSDGDWVPSDSHVLAFNDGPLPEWKRASGDPNGDSPLAPPQEPPGARSAAKAPPAPAPQPPSSEAPDALAAAEARLKETEERLHQAQARAQQAEDRGEQLTTNLEALKRRLDERAKETEEQIAKELSRREAWLAQELERREAQLEEELNVHEAELVKELRREASQSKSELAMKVTARAADAEAELEQLRTDLAEAKKAIAEREKEAERVRDAAAREADAAKEAREKLKAQQATPQRPKREPPPGKVDLNDADFETFRSLGLSVTQSARVIAQREQRRGFNSLDELDEVWGMPRELLEMLKQKTFV
jgi:DNA uptake protein ComE-like DNA-binding protein